MGTRPTVIYVIYDEDAYQREMITQVSRQLDYTPIIVPNLAVAPQHSVVKILVCQTQISAMREPTECSVT